MTQLTDPAWGLGLATLTEDDVVLDVWFPAGKLGLGTPAADHLPTNAALRADWTEPLLGLMPGTLGPRPLRGLTSTGILVQIASLADPPKDAFDVWLRLHLLSYRFVKPRETNLDGVFGLLANVAWTSAGPCPPERVDELR